MADPLRLVMANTISKQMIQSGVKKQWNKNIRNHLALGTSTSRRRRRCRWTGRTVGARQAGGTADTTGGQAGRPCPGFGESHSHDGRNERPTARCGGSILSITGILCIRYLGGPSFFLGLGQAPRPPPPPPPPRTGPATNNTFLSEQYI
jgi:hypothetical protein